LGKDRLQTLGHIQHIKIYDHTPGTVIRAEHNKIIHAKLDHIEETKLIESINTINTIIDFIEPFSESKGSLKIIKTVDNVDTVLCFDKNNPVNDVEPIIEQSEQSEQSEEPEETIVTPRTTLPQEPDLSFNNIYQQPIDKMITKENPILSKRWNDTLRQISLKLNKNDVNNHITTRFI
jgi:hypothetical protein